MDRPHHGGSAFMIARHPQPGSLVLASKLVDNEVSKDRQLKMSLMKKERKPDCMKTSDGLGCVCDICKDVVAFSKEMIIDHVPTEEQVLDKVCRRVFSEDKRKEELCESIVKKDLPEIIRYVKKRMDPAKCCQKFC